MKPSQLSRCSATPAHGTATSSSPSMKGNRISARPGFVHGTSRCPTIGRSTRCHAKKPPSGSRNLYYREQVLNTDGKAVDWSDSWQHGDYVAGYHRGIDALRGESAPGSEILTELYVPRESLAKFLTQAGAILRAGNANLIYGTVRLIERDDETVLAWAKRDYACVIFNLHTQRTPAEIERNGSVFRQLLDAAIGLDGSYYLTYHRFAQPDQTARCYPRFAEFLSAKRRYDPHETLDSDWYQHYRKQFEDSGLTNHRK